MTDAASLAVRWSGAADEAAIVSLFERDSSPCFCRYWHFEGDKNAWLARCAGEPEVNRDALSVDLRSGADAARALVALTAQGQCVGWMKLAPRRAVPKLRKLPVYRALDLGDDDGVWSVGCFLVDEAWRGRGVARRLVSEIPRALAPLGARAVEAYPRQGLHAAEAWTGPAKVFEAFSRVGGDDAYPVLRLVL